MKGKHLIFILTPLVVLATIWLFLKTESNKDLPETTTQNKESATITTPLEVSPAMIETSPPQETTPKARTLLGEIPKEGMNSLRYLNTPSAHWKKYYEAELRRFQNDESDIQVTHEEAGLKIMPDKTALYIEKVLVMIRHPNGREDSFNALIDSSSGKVIQTFNFVKRDDLPKHGEEKKGMTPTGVIRSTP